MAYMTITTANANDKHGGAQDGNGHCISVVHRVIPCTRPMEPSSTRCSRAKMSLWKSSLSLVCPFWKHAANQSSPFRGTRSESSSDNISALQISGGLGNVTDIPQRRQCRPVRRTRTRVRRIPGRHQEILVSKTCPFMPSGQTHQLIRTRSRTCVDALPADRVCLCCSQRRKAAQKVR
jgi:hypothetical protein